MKLSIIIPTYQESKRLARTADELRQACAAMELRPEILVVDDGSTDDTVEVARKCLAPFPAARVLCRSPNRGKGYVVREGMLAARGDFRLFMDADGSTRMTEIGRFLTHMGEAEIVIASIGLREATVTRRQPFPRGVAGKIANLVIQLLALPGIKDTQRGFKMFSARAAEDIFRRCSIDGWAFDVEALAVGRRLGYRIKELPVTWEHREDSRVGVASYFGTLIDLLRVRWRLWRGDYDAERREPDPRHTG